MYSLELLMMDRKTVRNTYSITSNKITLKHLCVQLVLLQKYTTKHGPMNVRLVHTNFLMYNEISTVYNILYFKVRLLLAWHVCGQVKCIQDAGVET